MIDWLLSVCLPHCCWLDMSWQALMFKTEVSNTAQGPQGCYLQSAMKPVVSCRPSVPLVAHTNISDAASGQHCVLRRICLLTYLLTIIFQIMLAYLFRQVWSYDKEVIRQLLLYRYLYQAPASITALSYTLGSYRHWGLIHRPIRKQPCDNL